MIGKGKSIAHTAAAINYAVVKEKAEVIDKINVTGHNANDITNEFKQFQELNGRCKNNTLSFVLSPSIPDGDKLTNKDYKEIARDFLKAHGLTNNQAVVLKHKDKEHTHLHIYANRIDMNGVALDDSFIGKKSQRIAEEIAINRGLTVARDIQLQKEESQKSVKDEIKYRFENAIKTAKPRDINEFWEALKANKIEVKKTINKAGKLQGYRVVFDGHNFKASEIGNKYTISKIDRTLQQANRQQNTNKPYKFRR